MFNPSVSFIQDTIVACYGESCDKLEEGAWVKMADTREIRAGHSSEVIRDSVYLVGGYGSPYMTELVKVTGEAVNGFSLYPGRYDHCSVKISDNIVITGGQLQAVIDGQVTHQVTAQVTEFSGLGGEVTARELPDLLTGRRYHGCGQYMAGETQVMVRL